MFRAVATAFAVAAVSLAGVAAGMSGPNVRGTLDRSGARLSCFPDEPCDPNPVGVFVVFSRGRHEPVRARVRPNGSFALRLSPGSYRISLAPPPLSGRVRPARVRVPRAGVTRLRLEIRR